MRALAMVGWAVFFGSLLIFVPIMLFTRYTPRLGSFTKGLLWAAAIGGGVGVIASAWVMP